MLFSRRKGWDREEKERASRGKEGLREGEAKKKIENGGAGQCKCSQGDIVSTQLVVCIRYNCQLKISSYSAV